MKDSYYSPFAQRRVLLDLKPPVIAERLPSGTAYDLVPYVGASLTDTVLTTGTPSGIVEQVTALMVNGSTVPFTYDPATGRLQWVDAATGLPPRLTDGASYAVTAEGGDRAGYKVSSSWSFTVAVGDTDHSAPSVANKVPIGASAPALPEISCKVFDNQSGIILESIVLSLDGAVVVSAANIHEHWDAYNQRVFFTPPAPFANYTPHTAAVTASHWADIPADKKTTTESWSFTVAY